MSSSKTIKARQRGGWDLDIDPHAFVVSDTALNHIKIEYGRHIGRDIHAVDLDDSSNQEAILRDVLQLYEILAEMCGVEEQYSRYDGRLPVNEIQFDDLVVFAEKVLLLLQMPQEAAIVRGWGSDQINRQDSSQYDELVDTPKTAAERDLWSALDDADRHGTLPASLRETFRNLLPACFNSDDFILNEPTSKILPSERVTIILGKQAFCIKHRDLLFALKQDINQFYLVTERNMGGFAQAEHKLSLSPDLYTFAAVVAANVYVDGDDVRRHVFHGVMPKLLVLSDPTKKRYIWGRDTVLHSNMISGVHGREDDVYRLRPVKEIDESALMKGLMHELATLAPIGKLPTAVLTTFRKVVSFSDKKGGRRPRKSQKRSKKRNRSANRKESQQLLRLHVKSQLPKRRV